LLYGTWDLSLFSVFLLAIFSGSFSRFSRSVVLWPFVSGFSYCASLASEPEHDDEADLRAESPPPSPSPSPSSSRRKMSSLEDFFSNFPLPAD
jgi:hypothetical protein